MLKTCLSLLLAITLLAACGGRNKDAASEPKMVVRLKAKNLVQLQVEIFEYWPQVMYAGRGYSYEGLIAKEGKGFGAVTLEYAQKDLLIAADEFCIYAGGRVSRFYNYSKAEVGIPEARIYFNCE